MEELADSGSLLGDWAALRERIASTGYVFVRGLLMCGHGPRCRQVGAATPPTGWLDFTG